MPLGVAADSTLKRLSPLPAAPLVAACLAVAVHAGRTATAETHLTSPHPASPSPPTPHRGARTRWARRRLSRTLDILLASVQPQLVAERRRRPGSCSRSGGHVRHRRSRVRSGRNAPPDSMCLPQCAIRHPSGSGQTTYDAGRVPRVPSGRHLAEVRVSHPVDMIEP